MQRCEGIGVQMEHLDTDVEHEMKPMRRARAGTHGRYVDRAAVTETTGWGNRQGRMRRLLAGDESDSMRVWEGTVFPQNGTAEFLVPFDPEYFVFTLNLTMDWMETEECQRETHKAPINAH